jgi:hypothetical protein
LEQKQGERGEHQLITPNAIMTSQIPEASKINLSPKKKAEKVLPLNNPQTNTNGQPSQRNGTENSKPATVTPPTVSKAQNSPTQAEIAAANQKKETEQAIQQLRTSICNTHEKLIQDCAKKPQRIQKDIDKITTGKQGLENEFTVYGLAHLKKNTELLSKQMEGMNDEWKNADGEISGLLSSLKESIFKVEEVKAGYKAHLDPSERKLMEIMPIESQESEKRNDFRTKLSNTTFLINLLKSEIAENQSNQRSKKPVSLDYNFLTLESIAKNNLITIRQKSLVLDDLTTRVQRLHGITRGESLERDSYRDDDDDEMNHVREMSLAPTEDGRQKVKKVLLKKLNHAPDKLKT